jgi:hypothetical protein
VKTLKKIAHHDALVALGRRTAEVQRHADETGQLLPVLADKDCGLSWGMVSTLARQKYVMRKANMLGDSVTVTHVGLAYLAAHRGDTRDAELVARFEALDERVRELRAESQGIKRTNWISGQLGRATDAEIQMLEYQMAGLRAERRRSAGDAAS